jgi:cytochrome c oxidase subunit 2
MFRYRSPACVALFLWLITPAALAAELQLQGQTLFRNNCAECHQQHGRGINDVYPALDGSELVLGSGADVALVLIIGRGEMPSFKGAMSAAEMTAIINYVRNAWSNSGELISEQQVAALLEP